MKQIIGNFEGSTTYKNSVSRLFLGRSFDDISENTGSIFMFNTLFCRVDDSEYEEACLRNKISIRLPNVLVIINNGTNVPIYFYYSQRQTIFVDEQLQYLFWTLLRSRNKYKMMFKTLQCVEYFPNIYCENTCQEQVRPTVVYS